MSCAAYIVSCPCGNAWRASRAAGRGAAGFVPHELLPTRLRSIWLSAAVTASTVEGWAPHQICRFKFCFCHLPRDGVPDQCLATIRKSLTRPP